MPRLCVTRLSELDAVTGERERFVAEMLAVQADAEAKLKQQTVENNLLFAQVEEVLRRLLPDETGPRIELLGHSFGVAMLNTAALAQANFGVGAA